MGIRKIIIWACAALVAGSAHAEIDLQTPEGVVALNRRIHCSTEDGAEKTYLWQGRAYARRQGEPDKL